MFKIAQISDTHIGPEGEFPEGIDVRLNLQNTLKSITSRSVDLIIHTGDLAWRTGDAAIYSWIRRQLDQTQIPWVTIPGNHDNLTLMRSVLKVPDSESSEKLYYQHKIGDQTALFLDTADERVGETQTAWLIEQLTEIKRSGRRNVMLFMHHPPLKGHHRFLDKAYPLLDGDRVLSHLINSRLDIHLFCGHYHMDKIVKDKNITHYFAPSTYFQIDGTTEDFRISGTEPAWRLIQLNGNGISASRSIACSRKSSPP